MELNESELLEAFQRLCAKNEEMKMKAPVNMDRTLNFPMWKTHTEIKASAEAKIKKLADKIEERQKRVADLRREHEIDDAALVELLTAARKAQNNAMQAAMTYTLSNTKASSGKGMGEERIIGAGVVNFLLTENDFIESEKEQVKKLQLIVRNLQPIAVYHEGKKTEMRGDFQLSYEELEYLGF